MGQIHTNLRLINAADEGMSLRGLIERQQVRVVNVEGVVDMSAVRSLIPADLKEKLGLQIERQILAQMADGEIRSVEMTEPAYIEIFDRVATESFIVLGSEVLIGMTVLNATDLQVDNLRQCVITNPDHPNSTVIRIR